MSVEIITLLFLIAILVGALSGYPIGLVLGGWSLFIGYINFGTSIFDLMYIRSFSFLLNYTMLAIPLFIFMGYILGHTGIAKRMYQSLYLIFSGLRGGLAAITIIIGTVLAACVGVIGASIAILSVLALPSMVEKKYNKGLASGSVAAGGTLGILIPPSVMLVIYGPMANISVGKLFLGAMTPGLLLAGLYVLYILIRSSLQPELGPAAPVAEREVPLLQKSKMLLLSLLPPAFLVFSVLGVIYLGIAAPTEAAAVGSAGAIILGIAYRKFTMAVLKESVLNTLKVTGFIMFIGIFANALVGVFLKLGCGEVVANLILSMPGGKWGAFAIIMAIIFAAGMFIDWIGIIFIMVPIISPIVTRLGFDPVWFAIMVCVNLQLSFMTPPMAPAIFYLRGMVSKEMGINTGQIIRGVLPFIGIIMITILLLVLFPEIITWLPNRMVRVGW
ncbi:MAG: TRAP transporter large permease subunit [Halanaerobiales bacterium]|nr:TRAP transporter large permease subunit [Halanaerobiales bacterium]